MTGFRRRVVGAAFAAAVAVAVGLGLAPAKASAQELTMWSHWAAELPKRQFVEEAIRRFQAANPGVTIKVTWYEKNALYAALRTALRAGQGPDILYAEPDQVEYMQNNLVLDLTKALQSTDLLALKMSDTILMVAQLELSSLRNVVRLVHVFGGEDGLADKVKVVLNRVGADMVEEGISLKKAEEVIGKPIYWQIPFDPKPVIAARVSGQPLVKHAPKSRVQQAMAGLANALTGKGGAMPAAAEQKRSVLGGLFGKR